MAAGTVASRALGFVRSAVLVAALGSALTNSTFTGRQHGPQHHLHPAGRRRPQRGVRPAAGARDEGGCRALPGLQRPAADPGRPGAAGRSRVVATAAAPLVIGLYTGRLTPEPTPTSRRCSRSGACRRSSSTASTRCSGRSSTRPEQLRPDDVGPGRSTTWSPSRPGSCSSRVYTVDELDPSSLPTGAIALLGRRHHPGRRAAGPGPGAGAAPARLRLATPLRLPRLRPGQGPGPGQVDPAVRAGQPARLHRDRQPGTARGRRGDRACSATESVTRPTPTPT